jgi:hypothetical protein
LTGHPTERVNARAIQRKRLADDIVEHPSILSTAKEIFLMVAANHDVITRAGNMQTETSRHPCLLIYESSVIQGAPGT